MSVSGEDLDRACEVVEPAVDRVAAEILAAGVNPGFLGAALVLAGSSLVSENDGPDRAVRLLGRVDRDVRGLTQTSRPTGR